jgi:hypothetical protein
MQYQRFHEAVARLWARDDAKVLKLWNEGRTIEEIRKVVPISERTFWQIVEAAADKEKEQK